MIVNEIAKFWNPPIAAEELLRVAELVQDLLVARRAGAGPGVVPFPSALLARSVSCQRYYARLATSVVNVSDGTSVGSPSCLASTS